MINNDGLRLPARSGGLEPSRSEPSANIGKILETGKTRNPYGQETEENRGGILTFTIVKKHENPHSAFYKFL